MKKKLFRTFLTMVIIAIMASACLLTWAWLEFAYGQEEIIRTPATTHISWTKHPAPDVRDYGIWIIERVAGATWRQVGRTAELYFDWQVPLEDQEKVYQAAVSVRDWSGTIIDGAFVLDGNEITPLEQDLQRSVPFRPDGIPPEILLEAPVIAGSRTVTIFPDGTIRITVQ